MKKSNTIIAGSAALVALVAVTGLVVTSFAASGSETEYMPKRFFSRQLSDEERDEWRAKMENRRVEFIERREAVKNALDAADYTAFVQAIGDTDCHLSGKINESNFSRLVEAHQLREQARNIMEELGIEREGVEFKKRFMNRLRK